MPTGIEWTDATWNPVTGCIEVSPGCDNCYARRLAHGRLRKHYLKRVSQQVRNSDDPFAVRLWPERMDQPRRWREPRLVFVNSMSDLFHADIPETYIRSIFEVMLEANQHTYQVLTKRPGRMGHFVRRHRSLFPDGVVPEHVWLGTSIEDMAVEYRVRHLRNVPAVRRFLSCEPLLGPLRLNLDGIHWVIVGGESGPGARPMHPDWARSIRDQCVRVGVPFFFKQWGAWMPTVHESKRCSSTRDYPPTDAFVHLDGSVRNWGGPLDRAISRVGKRKAGRVLDGRTWDEYPEAAS